MKRRIVSFPGGVAPAGRTPGPATRRRAGCLLAAACFGAAGCAPDWTPLEGALLGDLDGFSGLPGSPRAGASDDFWAHWGDGQAELSGYSVTVSRYGAPREGVTSLIYVTEPHDRRTWVKDDRAESPNRVEVMKLIRSTHFLTGIYPYSVMASTFVPVEAWGDIRFQPVRINLDVQEWCGSVSHRIWPGPGRLRSLRLSYFADEGESLIETTLPEGTLFEDALPIQLRELDGPFSGGGDWTGWIVPELWRLRANHGPTQPVEATISRKNGEREGVPVTHFLLEAGDYWRRYDVETAFPRRILGWETATGDAASLLSTERLAYWSLNAPGDELFRERLGLSATDLLPPANDGAACPVTATPDSTR
ncbi:MAG: hypothetical protein WEG36_02035 [Gemmatimonadota bacterium]